MKKRILSLMLVGAAVLLTQGCAANQEHAHVAPEETGDTTITVAAGDLFEACSASWQKGDEIKVSFSSSQPVLFDVHYHVDHELLYVKEPYLADEFTGSFIVQSEDIHCVMWENRNLDPVTLTYELKAQ